MLDEGAIEVDLSGPDLLSNPMLNKGTAFTESERDAFELHVHPVQPVSDAAAGPAAAEYLASNYYVDSADPLVRKLARQAAGGETGARAKALRIERWVNESMRPDSAAAFAPASQVARDLRGDCRAYALLTAALCRAEGYVGGTSVDFETVEKCPPRYRVSGRSASEGVCTMEHFVTKALCQ